MYRRGFCFECGRETKFTYHDGSIATWSCTVCGKIMLSMSNINLLCSRCNKDQSTIRTQYGNRLTMECTVCHYTRQYKPEGQHHNPKLSRLRHKIREAINQIK